MENQKQLHDYIKIIQSKINDLHLSNTNIQILQTGNIYIQCQKHDKEIICTLIENLDYMIITNTSEELVIVNPFEKFIPALATQLAKKEIRKYKKTPFTGQMHINFY